VVALVDVSSDVLQALVTCVMLMTHPHHHSSRGNVPSASGCAFSYAVAGGHVPCP